MIYTGKDCVKSMIQGLVGDKFQGPALKIMRKDRKRLKKARSILCGILDTLKGGTSSNKKINSEMHSMLPNPLLQSMLQL